MGEFLCRDHGTEVPGKWMDFTDGTLEETVFPFPLREICSGGKTLDNCVIQEVHWTCLKKSDPSCIILI